MNECWPVVQLIAHKMPGWTADNVAARMKNFRNRAPKGKKPPPRAPDAHTAFCDSLCDCVAQVRCKLICTSSSSLFVSTILASNITNV